MINGKSSHVLVCCNDGGTVYLAREHKGHEGIKGSPVEIYGGILIYNSDFQKFTIAAPYLF